ncbi:MAG: carboxymuconolactone decarboxylase family protein [Methylobacter sp.]|uniref:carboxymuconolactone decarboxylase family protein n=1 Tax=Methylovulum miyakonense TaxID=645578 RepID=UPI00036829CB|nr:carboxymuconolactone decarboxylase family protein [Methylovulum miyakonense]PPD50948.1 MAG: carboxymuconolactone decarboxylase family protein [Methylobacter sp.]
MKTFSLHTLDTAPEASKPLLSKAKQDFGFIPNLLAGMAESPALLEGYRSLAASFDKTRLSEAERQIILLTTSRVNGCRYCMAAHTVIAKSGGVPDDVVTALRNQTPLADPKLEALRQFAEVVVERRGWLEETDLQNFYMAGYTQENVLDVILGVGLKMLSNYTNHIAQTPLDTVFAKAVWPAG